MFVCEVTERGVGITHAYDWTNSLFDVTWSESSPSVLVTASGDGSLQAWHTSTPHVSLRNVQWVTTHLIEQ